MAESTSDNVSGFVAGLVGGCTGLVFGHPFDTVKVRQHIYSSNGCGLMRAIHLTTAHDGVLGFYKGMCFPLVSVGVLNSIFFGAYDNVRTLLAFGRHQGNKGQLTSFDTLVAGGIGGGIQAIPAASIELVKDLYLSPYSHHCEISKRLLASLNLVRCRRVKILPPDLTEGRVRSRLGERGTLPDALRGRHRLHEVHLSRPRTAGKLPWPQLHSDARYPGLRRLHVRLREPVPVAESRLPRRKRGVHSLPVGGRHSRRHVVDGEHPDGRDEKPSSGGRPRKAALPQPHALHCQELPQGRHHRLLAWARRHLHACFPAQRGHAHCLLVHAGAAQKLEGFAPGRLSCSPELLTSMVGV